MSDVGVVAGGGLARLENLRSQLLTATRPKVKEIWASITPTVLDEIAADWAVKESEVRTLLSSIESIPGSAVRSRNLRKALERLVAEDQRRNKNAHVAQIEAQVMQVNNLSAGFSVPDTVVDRFIFNDLKTPGGYSVDEMGVHKMRVDQEGNTSSQRVAAKPIFIAGRTIDIITGESKRQLVWRGASGWCSRVVDRRTIMDSRRILELSDFDAPVSSNTSGSLISYLSEFEAENAHRIPAVKSSSRMGWLPDGSFLLHDQHYTSRENETFTLTPPTGHESAAKGWSKSGSWTEWMRAVERVKGYPHMMISIYASCAAPVLEMLKVPGFVVDFSGETSGGKTTALRLAASVWGRPADSYPTAMYGWDATKVWIERTAGFLHSLPLILDETKRAKHRNVVRDVIYDFCQGQGRGRGSIDGTRHTESWRSVLISSGESAATKFSQDAGTRARVLSLIGKPLGNNALRGGRISEDVQIAIADNHGHMGRKMVEYLVANRGRQEQIVEVFRKVRAQYADTAKNAVARRQSSNLAVLDVTAKIAHSLGLPEPTVDPFMVLIETIDNMAEDADRPYSAMQDILSWCAVHQTRFWGRHDASTGYVSSMGWLGSWSRKIDWETIDIVSAHLRAVLIEHDYDPYEIIDRWLERGWLNRGGKRTTRVIRIDGVQARCYSISRKIAKEMMED